MLPATCDGCGCRVFFGDQWTIIDADGLRGHTCDPEQWQAWQAGGRDRIERERVLPFGS